MPSVPPGVFWYHASPLNWTAAEADCVSRGMHLASIRSAEENEWVRRVCLSDCWIGFTDAANETAWAWTDGWAGGTYVHWRAGEPNGQSAEGTDHAYMYIDSVPSGWAGEWDDEFAREAKAYVCRAPPLFPFLPSSLSAQGGSKVLVVFGVLAAFVTIVGTPRSFYILLSRL